MICGNSIYYFAGVGGMGMCPLAIYLAQQGCQVVGFDDHLRSDVKELLISQGVQLDFHGKIPALTQTLIYSNAITEGHSIRIQAESMGISCMRRGEFLAKTLKNKRLIAVVGSHGKTTTSGVLISLLKESNFDFGYLLGALFQDAQISPAQYAGSDWVVAEVDESDGSIDAFDPEITLVVNFDWDHPNRYKSPEDLMNTFAELFQRTRKAVFLPKDCLVLGEIVKQSDLKAELYTFGPGGDYSADFPKEGIPGLTLQAPFPSVSIPAPQAAPFNCHNTLAALAVTFYLTGAIPVAPASTYSGIKRRLHWLYRSDSLEVMMDYAHHPAEIKALLEFAKKDFSGTLTVFFEPHRYTRTQLYYREFAISLLPADEVYLFPVYPAFEAPIASGGTKAIYDVLNPQHSNAELIDFSSEVVSEKLAIQPSKAPRRVLFVGAGSIEKLAVEYAQTLWWKDLTGKLSEATIFRENEALSPKTTLRTGGTARFYAEPAALDDLLILTNAARTRVCPFFILGRGSNVIIPDDGFGGLIIRMNQPYWKTIQPLENNRLWVAAGARLKEVCGQACRLGMAGFEFFEGIPGSIGGALRMNAGAMGGWFFDIVESVQYLDRRGNVYEVSPEEMKLGYRYCKELQDGIALSAVLKSSENLAPEQIRNKLEEYSESRKISQPREPSAGCIFKNPEGNFAGQLIERAGLKGHVFGGAAVSSVHANFIINRGEATSSEVIGLVEHVRKQVHEVTGIRLEPEVLLLGKSWEEVLS